MAKEEQFVSIVIYLHNCEKMIQPFLAGLFKVVHEKFKQYEVIFVDDASTDLTIDKLIWEGIEKTTLIRLNVHHGLELAMNAGVDLSVGDYVFEIDFVEKGFPFRILCEAYDKAMEGNDIVNICPNRIRGMSKLFYRIFNRYSDAFYQIKTNACRLVSRRAINRVNSISENQPYRKAAYAACGLKQTDIFYKGCVPKKEGRLNLTIDSLILYTNAGFRASVGITITMFLLAFFELLYTVVIFVAGHPIEGWTTTMLVITIGFAGLFSLQAIIIKFLSIILDLNFKKQKYKIESVERLPNRNGAK